MKLYTLHLCNGFGVAIFRGVYTSRERAEEMAAKHPPGGQFYYETEEVPADRFWVNGVDETDKTS